jgi:beta-phosphoglucomutase
MARSIVGRSMPDAPGADCTLIGQMRPVRAVAFDFNGTLSDDEPILLSVYQEMFGERGRPLTEAEYFDTLAGLSEEAIIASWLGVRGALLDALVEERIDRYLAKCGAGQTVSATVRDAVAYAAARVPVAVVSGAFRREIEPVLAGAQLDGYVSVLVAADDVERGKPDPAGYLLALELLGGIAASEAVAFEDTEAGVASAKAAGLRCIAVVGTHPPERLRLADERVARLDSGLLGAVLE